MCGCGKSGLAGPRKRRAYASGLGALISPGGGLGALYSGSRVRVGFAFNYNMAYPPSEIETTLVSYIQNAMYSYLADGVTFKDVDIQVSAPGWLSDGYITFSATTNTELPTADVFGDMAEYGLKQYLPRIVINRRDETLIDYVSPGNVGKPGAQQPGPPKVCSWATMDLRDYVDCQLGLGKFGQPSGTTTPGTGNKLPAAPGQCQWSSMSTTDWLACQLGVTPTSALVVGGVGALILIAVLSRR